MRAWLLILGGLIVWAAHFVAIYAIASAFPGQPVARWPILATSALAIGADFAILWRTARPHNDPLDVWMLRVARAAAALSILAVIWQTGPVLST